MSTEYTVEPQSDELQLDQEEVSYLARILKSIKRRFPQDLVVDEIKVFEDLEGNMAEAVQTVRAGAVNYYIYVDREVFESQEWIVEGTMAHEMVHLYCYQNGHTDISDGDPMFEWMCGRVGAIQTDFNPKNHMFKEMILPFMKKAEYYPKDYQWD